MFPIQNSGVFGFPNQNMQMQGMNMGGNGWMGIYNLINQNQQQNMIQNNFIQNNNSLPKINIVFRTTKALRTNITIDYGKTVSELIQLYFKRVDKPELFNRPLDICFIFNANKMDFNDQTPVQNYFQGVYNPFITVNDTKDLIGA